MRLAENNYSTGMRGLSSDFVVPQTVKRHVHAAFVAIAAGSHERSDASFAAALGDLPDLPGLHPFWIPLTALAAIGGAKSGAAFEELLDARKHLNIQWLMSLKLPARTNFLLHCIANDRLHLGIQLALAAEFPAEHSYFDIEEWAFRVASLEILWQAGRDSETAVYASACVRRLHSVSAGLRESQSAGPMGPAAEVAALACAQVHRRLSVFALRTLREPGQAVTLARDGLELIANVEAAAAVGQLDEILLEAEMAETEALVGVVEGDEVVAQVKRVLSRGARLGWRHRAALLRVATRAFEAARRGRYQGLGIAIVEGLAALPDPLEGCGVNVAMASAHVHRRLSVFMLRILKEPGRAAALARRGLDEAAGCGEPNAAAVEQLEELLIEAEAMEKKHRRLRSIRNRVWEIIRRGWQK